jgi:two-component system NarL family sensor kinase
LAANGSSEDALQAENAALREELDTCRQLVAQVLDAEDSARRRIAQLIHDDALQNLLAANQELMEAAPGRVQVKRAHEVVEGTIARLREAMMALHPVTLEQGGFETALGAVARQAARQGGFNVELDIDPQALDIADTLLLAIARELLTNAARHAKAEEVTVILRRVGDVLELEVTDDGRGMARGRREQALSEGHIGLASVYERVRSVNGEFAVESSESGTRALARLPLADVLAAAG